MSITRPEGSTAPAASNGPATEVPPLQNGDRLTRAEFERRYDAMPDVKKAELINGVVYMPSPVKHRRHGNPHFNLIAWLGQYQALTPGTEGGDNSSLRLELESEPQPDAFLIIQPEYGGRVRIDADDYIVGGPELVAEVAASSASYDLHDKLQAYRDNGVKEYIVWRVLERKLDWFVLQAGADEQLPLTPDGFYQSREFPGLWLDPKALMAWNQMRVLQVVQQGVATPEHQRFIAELATRRQSSEGST